MLKKELQGKTQRNVLNDFCRCWVTPNRNAVHEKCPDYPTQGKMLSYVRGSNGDTGKENIYLKWYEFQRECRRELQNFKKTYGVRKINGTIDFLVFICKCFE